jgi:plasmid stabilization system protein ParE
VNRRISFHEAAEREIIDAVSFFQSERPELGGAFTDQVEQAIHQILMYPLSCQLVNRTVRRKVLRRFRYYIMYSVKPDVIRILAIASHRRRPFYWRGRV